MTRTLGRSGIQVSALGMGCWAIGGPFWRGETPSGWGEVDDEESIRAIHRALELGVTFFDTANVYGAGHSERVLARALKGKRAQVVIATKFSNVFDETTRQVTGADATPPGIRRACEDSLRRLDTDVIDLYQFHDNGYPADQSGPLLETLEDLVRQGKIRAYGWSTDFPDRARAFAEGKNCTSIQFMLNVLDDNAEVIAVCEKNGLAAINRGSACHGSSHRHLHRCHATGGRRRSRGEKPGVDEVLQERQAQPGMAAKKRRRPRGAHQWRAVALARRCWLAVGTQSNHDPHPRFPHREAGGRKRRGHGARRVEPGPDGADREDPRQVVP